MSSPAFPGAIGVSHLRVYDSVAPDGLRGGAPHVHSVCSEAYLVVAGRGAVQALADFHAQVARLVAPRAKGWRDLVEQGPIAALRATEAQLESLSRGVAPHLADASVHRLPPPLAERRMGCCGTLGVYLREAIEPDCAAQTAR